MKLRVESLSTFVMVCDAFVLFTTVTVVVFAAMIVPFGSTIDEPKSCVFGIVTGAGVRISRRGSDVPLSAVVTVPPGLPVIWTEALRAPRAVGENVTLTVQ